MGNCSLNSNTDLILGYTWVMVKMAILSLGIGILVVIGVLI